MDGAGAFPGYELKGREFYKRGGRGGFQSGIRSDGEFPPTVEISMYIYIIFIMIIFRTSLFKQMGYFAVYSFKQTTSVIKFISHRGSKP